LPIVVTSAIAPQHRLQDLSAGGFVGSFSLFTEHPRRQRYVNDSVLLCSVVTPLMFARLAMYPTLGQNSY
jgi:hypothetical protein